MPSWNTGNANEMIASHLQPGADLEAARPRPGAEGQGDALLAVDPERDVAAVDRHRDRLDRRRVHVFAVVLVPRPAFPAATVPIELHAAELVEAQPAHARNEIVKLNIKLLPDI